MNKTSSRWVAVLSAGVTTKYALQFFYICDKIWMHQLDPNNNELSEQ